MAAVGCILAREQLLRLQDTLAIVAVRRGLRASGERQEANSVGERVTDLQNLTQKSFAPLSYEVLLRFFGGPIAIKGRGY